MKQYEIWWADLAEPAGTRPVLLLSRNDAYGVLTKFIAVEITTKVRNIATEVVLGEEEGLPRACVANCDNLRMIPRTVLARRAGLLHPDRWVEVKRAVGIALAWSELMDLDLPS